MRWSIMNAVAFGGIRTLAKAGCVNFILGLGCVHFMRHGFSCCA